MFKFTLIPWLLLNNIYFIYSDNDYQYPQMKAKLKPQLTYINFDILTNLPMVHDVTSILLYPARSCEKFLDYLLSNVFTLQHT